MAPITFEKRKFDKDNKNPRRAGPVPAFKKTPSVRRPTFGSFPTEQGLLKPDDVKANAHALAQTLDHTFSKPRFNLKKAAVAAVTTAGVIGGIGALVLSRRQKKSVRKTKLGSR